MKNKNKMTMIKMVSTGFKKQTLVALISFGCFAMFVFSANAQTFRDFDNIQFYGSGNGSATEDLAYDYGWTRSDTNIVVEQTGKNGYVRMPRNTTVVTESLNFLYGDTLSIGYRVTNISGGGSVTRYFSITLIDEEDVETTLYTSPSISVSTVDFECLVMVIHMTGTYKVRFDYKANGGNNLHYFQFDNFTTYSPLTLLPVSFTSFESKLDKSDAIITWSTAMEEHVEGFEVEFSVDGNSFQYAGFVQALGGEFTGHHYEFTHYNVFSEINSTVVYYRLKVIDTDGSYSYSDLTEVIMLKVKSDDKITFNNPFGNTLQLNIKDKSLIREIKISDLQGKVVVSLFNHNMSNSGVEQINTSVLRSGVYLMSIIKVNGTVESSKLIKQ